MLKIISRVLSVVAAFVMVVGTASADVMSLRGHNVFDAEIVDGNATKEYVGDKPGKQKVYARAWHSAPPQVSHTMENMVMTPKKNTCLECHDRETYEMAEAPVMGDSHYRNTREGKDLDKMYQGRFNCVQCHVGQVDAAPLVANTFQGTKYDPSQKKATKKKKSGDDLF